jgi:hypothetical protein
VLTWQTPVGRQGGSIQILFRPFMGALLHTDATTATHRLATRGMSAASFLTSTTDAEGAMRDGILTRTGRCLTEECFKVRAIVNRHRETVRGWPMCWRSESWLFSLLEFMKLKAVVSHSLNGQRPHTSLINFILMRECFISTIAYC